MACAPTLMSTVRRWMSALSSATNVTYVDVSMFFFFSDFILFLLMVPDYCGPRRKGTATCCCDSCDSLVLYALHIIIQSVLLLVPLNRRPAEVTGRWSARVNRPQKWVQFKFSMSIRIAKHFLHQQNSITWARALIILIFIDYTSLRRPVTEHRCGP